MPVVVVPGAAVSREVVPGVVIAEEGIPWVVVRGRLGDYLIGLDCPKSCASAESPWMHAGC